MPYVNLRPSQVILDPENPRLPDGTSSDREAINRLLDEGAEALVNLARDLARTGQANPTELPIATKVGSKYLVLEGNRRFAALKLLADPTLADNEGHQKSFRRAAALGNPPKTVYTFVVSNREEPEHWISLRHTGENNGTGIRRWSAEQAATHRRRVNKTVDAGTLRSITIANELEEAYATDGEIVELVRQIRRGKLTNIGRFFSPDVLTALHFTIRVDGDSNLRTRTLLVCHSAEQLRDFFAWALAFIQANSVDAYKNSEKRRSALRKVAHLLPNIADVADEPFRLVDRPIQGAGDFSGEWTDESSDAAEESASSAEGSEDGIQADSSTQSSGGPVESGGDSDGSPGQSELRKKREAKPERFLLQGLRLPNHPLRVQQLLKECRNLTLDDSPGIACVMMRVIVELAVSSPEALNLSGATEAASLKNKIIAMLRYLDPQIEHPMQRDKGLAQAYLEASELGIQYLNGFVHNPAVTPDSHLARRFSSAFRVFLERVDLAL